MERSHVEAAEQRPSCQCDAKVQQSRGSVRRALNKSSNRQTAAKNALFRNEAFLVLIIYLPLSFFLKRNCDIFGKIFALLVVHTTVALVLQYCSL